MRWPGAVRLLALEKEEAQRLGAAVAAQEQLAEAKRGHFAARRAHHEPIVRSKVQALDHALEAAAARNEELRQAWLDARAGGVGLDTAFWRALLPGDGSRLAGWRRSVRSLGWLK